MGNISKLLRRPVLEKIMLRSGKIFAIAFVCSILFVAAFGDEPMSPAMLYMLILPCFAIILCSLAVCLLAALAFFIVSKWKGRRSYQS